MRPFLWALALLFMLYGCSGERRAIKRLERLKTTHPELFSETVKSDTVFSTDTVMVSVPGFFVEGEVFTPDMEGGTVIFEGDGVETTATYKRDSIKEVIRWKWKTVVEKKTVEVPVDRVEYITTTVDKVVTATKKVLPWWWWLVVVGLLSALAYSILKKRR